MTAPHVEGVDVAEIGLTATNSSHSTWLEHTTSNSRSATVNLRTAIQAALAACGKSRAAVLVNGVPMQPSVPFLCVILV